MAVSIEEVKKFYDKESYRKLNDFVYSNARVEYAFQTLGSVLNYIQPKAVLEIGCGIGSVSWRLASKLPSTMIVGFDVSQRSFDLASHLFALPNLTFVRRDSISDFRDKGKEKFDIIFLMDVYEHIAVRDRQPLHKFIQENLSDNGFLFLSCPTPRHLSYLKKNIPSEIQPIDEDISLEVLNTMSNETSLKIIYYKEVSVWHSGDYLHTFLSKSMNMRQFSDFKSGVNNQPIQLKREILMRVKRKLGLQEKSKTEEGIRKSLIREKLGSEILERTETAV